MVEAKRIPEVWVWPRASWKAWILWVVWKWDIICIYIYMYMYLHIYTHIPKVCEVFFLDAWHEIHGCIHMLFAWFHHFSYFGGHVSLGFGSMSIFSSNPRKLDPKLPLKRWLFFALRTSVAVKFDSSFLPGLVHPNWDRSWMYNNYTETQDFIVDVQRKDRTLRFPVFTLTGRNLESFGR